MSKPKRSTHDTALASQEFLHFITAKANELDIGRGLAVSLFGLYTKRIVEMDIADGDNPAVAHQRAVNAFLRGLGFEQAPIDAAEGGTHPLQ